MPARVSLTSAEKVRELAHDLICKVCGQTHRDSADTFGSCPSHNAIIVFECIEEELDDELQLLDLVVVKLFLSTDVFFLLSRCTLILHLNIRLGRLRAMA